MKSTSSEMKRWDQEYHDERMRIQAIVENLETMSKRDLIEEIMEILEYHQTDAEDYLEGLRIRGYPK